MFAKIIDIVSEIPAGQEPYYLGGAIIAIIAFASLFGSSHAS